MFRACPAPSHVEHLNVPRPASIFGFRKSPSVASTPSAEPHQNNKAPMCDEMMAVLPGKMTSWRRGPALQATQPRREASTASHWHMIATMRRHVPRDCWCLGTKQRRHSRMPASQLTVPHSPACVRNLCTRLPGVPEYEACAQQPGNSCGKQRRNNASI